MYVWSKLTESPVKTNGLLTIIVISLLHTLRSGTLLTYIRFSAQRIPPWVRTTNTVEKPPGKNNDKQMTLLEFLLFL